MGHYSHTCKLSGVPITGGEPIVLVPIKRIGNLYDNSDETLKKYGTTYMCSNDGGQFKFKVWAYPIKGDYDDYGGVENIIEDDNTKVLEQYFGLPIQTIVDVICCGRKDDGYSDTLTDLIESEEKDEHGRSRVTYKEEYKELVSLSGMWVHRTVYDELTAESTKAFGSTLDLGTPQVLTSLGFTELDEKGTDKRYNRQFEKDGLVIFSDGTWLHTKENNQGIYNFKALAEYCKGHGVDIDITEHETKDAIEQLFDLIIPSMDKFCSDPVPKRPRSGKDYEEGKAHYYKIFGDREPDSYDNFLDATEDMITFYEPTHSGLNYRLLNFDRYRMINGLSKAYFDAAKAGMDIKTPAKEFWRLDHYMFSTGTFYDPCGVSPQDGEHESVLKVLEAGIKALQPRLAQIEEYRKEDEEWG